ncbi:hypothetical protein ACOMHN_060884 [Nucella lapillus]
MFDVAGAKLTFYLGEEINTGVRRLHPEVEPAIHFPSPSYHPTPSLELRLTCSTFPVTVVSPDTLTGAEVTTVPLSTVVKTSAAQVVDLHSRCWTSKPKFIKTRLRPTKPPSAAAALSRLG